MYGTQLVDNSSIRCFHLLNGNINLDWTSLIWLGLLTLILELVIYTIARLKNYYIPPRLMVALLILSAVILTEVLPYLFLQLRHSC